MLLLWGSGMRLFSDQVHHIIQKLQKYQLSCLLCVLDNVHSQNDAVLQLI